ncbi:hypothetical protein HDIA_4800 [Hartmannibacter diazotrophicus]|uniref:TNase-like domain-containing protein n=1 Tax=Hartmannibacter diazotrophicus TaxID=1482074 RepID=A0A2C9DEC1_9HYPH|nr:hypothetical protein HDIA_4800 [Hartmannibacter diazotrophicus]
MFSVFVAGLMLTLLIVFYAYQRYVVPDRSDTGARAEVGAPSEPASVAATGEGTAPTAMAAESPASAEADTTAEAREDKSDLPIPAVERNVTPAGVTQAPKIDGPLQRVPAPAPDQTRLTAVTTKRYFQPIVLDAGHARVADGPDLYTLAFAGVEAPDFKSTCVTHGGQTWRCGGEARGDLSRLVQGRALDCTPATPDAQNVIRTYCSIGRFDISMWLIKRGWARPADDATEEIRAAADEAKAAKIGIWQ